MRRRDRLAIAGFVCLIVQLFVGTAIVSVRSNAATSQRTPAVEPAVIQQATVNERVRGLTAALEERLKVIEGLRIDARLSVLEDTAARVVKIEALLYGAIVTLLGNLIMSILMVRPQRKGRSRRED